MPSTLGYQSSSNWPRITSNYLLVMYLVCVTLLFNINCYERSTSQPINTTVDPASFTCIVAPREASIGCRHRGPEGFVGRRTTGVARFQGVRRNAIAWKVTEPKWSTELASYMVLYRGLAVPLPNPIFVVTCWHCRQERKWKKSIIPKTATNMVLLPVIWRTNLSHDRKQYDRRVVMVVFIFVFALQNPHAFQCGNLRLNLNHLLLPGCWIAPYNATTCTAFASASLSEWIVERSPSPRWCAYWLGFPSVMLSPLKGPFKVEASAVGINLYQKFVFSLTCSFSRMCCL